MDFKDYLIYLAMAFLGLIVVGWGISLAVGFIVGSWHGASSSLHCDECATRAALLTQPKDEDIYSSRGES